MALDAVFVKDGLNLFVIAEESRFAEPRFEGLRLSRGGGTYDSRGEGRVDAAFMASEARVRLAGSRHDSAAHRLNHHLILVEELEIDEFLGGNGEGDASVFRDGNGSEDTFVVEVVPRHAGRLGSAPLPVGRSPEPFLGGFDDAEEFHGAGLHVLHAETFVDV